MTLVKFLLILVGLIAISACEAAGRTEPTPSPTASHIQTEENLPAPPPTQESGRVVNLSDDILTIDTTTGQRQLKVDSGTRLFRAAEYSAVLNTDLTRLRAGDQVIFAVKPQPDGTMVVSEITANGFIGRSGIVAKQANGLLDVYLRNQEEPAQYDVEATHFALATDATIARPRTAGIPDSNRASLEDIVPGARVALQGLIADDGTYVATSVWLPDP